MFLSLVFLMVCCKKDYAFVEKINNAVSTIESPTLYGEVLNIDDNRNMVFILDESCSVCIAGYISFCKYTSQCNYDSIATVVVHSKNMQTADYYLNKEKISRPLHENIIYDTKSEISRALYRISQGRNVLLFENHKLIFSCNMQEYLYTDDDLMKYNNIHEK